MSSKEVQQYLLSKLSYPHFPEEKQAIVKLLMLDKYGISAIDLITNIETAIDFKTLDEDIKLLNQKVPIQHVVGLAYFLDRPFTVSKDVLIPRPETEELVSLLLTAYRPQHVNPKILDIGTGSGCIAISMALGIPNAQVVAFDISENALSVARKNGVLNNAKVDFQLHDILREPTTVHKSYDLIVSNPPYVKEAEKVEMDAHVLDHEPHLALFVTNNDPLIFYRRIAAFAAKNLSESGVLAFEINNSLGNETLEEVKKHGFTFSELRQDFFGKDRFIFAKK
jgi:release factor glutamine methyltransferase